MRVITGSARGTRLKTLEGDAVRPTSEKVKEAVFSALQFEIEGRRMLDLFAGCGQMGIEALSRGAASVTFVDNAKPSLDTVRANLAAAHLEENAVVVSSDFASFLLHCREPFDIAFLDPPYHKGLLAEAVEKVIPHMRDTGVIVCEHPSGIVLPPAIGGFSVRRTYSYGKIRITVYRKEATL